MLRATSVAIGRIYAMHVMRPKMDVGRLKKKKETKFMWWASVFRFPTFSGKSWISFGKIFRPWKVLDHGICPGKF